MFNRLVAVALIIVCTPVFIVVALAIWITMGRPILFRQPRGGLGGQPFDLIKFRTMREEKQLGEADRERITRLGAILRSTSLDELPSLWNIVRGDMVFIGPRPLHARYVSRYDEFQARRLDAKPGLTGWAQVNGRNACTWQEKFEMDAWYIENKSLGLDMRILALTVWQVLRRAGISHGEEETMPEFNG